MHYTVTTGNIPRYFCRELIRVFFLSNENIIDN